MNKNIPNCLTILRIIMVFILIFIALYPFNYWNIDRVIIYDLTLKNMLICIIFIIASLTDFLDGFLARKFNLVSNFGKLMDPLADKMLVNTTLIIFSVFGRIPAIYTILFICRDLLVDGIRMLLLEKQEVIAASKLGKLKTIFQMIALPLIIINLRFSKFDLPMMLIIIALIASIVSMADYLYKNIRVFKNEKTVK